MVERQNSSDLDNSPLKASISEQRAQQINRWLLIGFILLVAALAAFLGLRVVNTAPEVSAERLAAEASLGMAGAKVQVIEYGAYGCTTCRALHQRGVMTQIMDSYGDQIEFRFRNLPIRISNDKLAAEAAQCALDQDEEAFWAFHNHLYDLSFDDFADLSEEADFVQEAQAAGLDADAMRECLRENTHQRTVEHWHDLARAESVTGTPTFFVNDRRVNSAGDLEDAIREELGL